MPPRWNRTPPCAEQIKLEKLFKDGKISKDSTAASVYNQHADFQKYTLDVFRSNFNAIRNSLGYERKCSFLYILACANYNS